MLAAKRAGGGGTNVVAASSDSRKADNETGKPVFHHEAQQNRRDLSRATSTTLAEEFYCLKVQSLITLATPCH